MRSTRLVNKPLAGNYVEVANSVCLPDLSSKELANFVNQGLAEGLLTIEPDFFEFLE